jgi:hypothetical protein
MEHNRRKSLGTTSLPAERQGASGAIAGGNSMRTDGDRELIRRTTVGQPENNTADNTIAAVITTTTAPTYGVLTGHKQLTTKAGKAGKSIKWTNEMIVAVIRSYMESTEAETDLTMYRQYMYKRFIETYPELSTRVNEQNLVDRKRAICNNMLPVIQIEQSKEQFRLEMNVKEQQDAHDDHLDTRIDEAHEEDKEDERTEITATHDNDNEEQGDIIENHFNTALIEFTGTEPCHRPGIPKPRQNCQLSKIVQYINSKILPKQLNNCEDREIPTHSILHSSSHYKNNRTENKTTTQHNKQQIKQIYKKQRTTVDVQIKNKNN